MTTREPDRLLREDRTLPADLRRAFAAYGAIVPSAEARDALFARIERGALSVVEHAPRPKPAQRTLRLVVLLGLSLVGAFVAWRFSTGEHEQTTSFVRAPDSVLRPAPGPAVEIQTVPAAPSTLVGAATERAMPREVASEPPTVVPAQRVMPFAPAAKRVPARARPASAALQKAAELADPAQELALLTRAKRILPSDAEAALMLTREHATRFPRGAFREEREVIAIESLARGGQREQALSRASAFRQAFPRSTHLDRLAVILHEL